MVAKEGGDPAPDKLMTLAEVADRLAVSRRTLEREISGKRFPPADLRVGRLPRWKPSTVAGWIDRGGAAR